VSSSDWEKYLQPRKQREAYEQQLAEYEKKYGKKKKTSGG
jgi:hypothetical protein